MEFGLPVRNRPDDPAHRLDFRFLADPPAGGPAVLTGHDEGVITLNIAEADDVERERRRASMPEPDRTLLGHFRHEIGHYYWDLLVRDGPHVEAFRRQFGDERVDYNQALQTHCANGPATDWPRRCVSAYASCHPWEDWTETWAHHLHMTDTLETATMCGLSLQPDVPANRQHFDQIIKNWFALTYAIKRPQPRHGPGRRLPVRAAPAGHRQAAVHPRDDVRRRILTWRPAQLGWRGASPTSRWASSRSRRC